eukprot:SAG31_NODE_1292_length_8967_cov_2.998985_5_plen_282_part_00
MARVLQAMALGTVPLLPLFCMFWLAPRPSGAESQWELHRLNLTKHPLATCLDGSPGVYYFRAGAESSKFFVTTEGGGWSVHHALLLIVHAANEQHVPRCTMAEPSSTYSCSTSDPCFNRSLAGLGSTNNEQGPPWLAWAQPGHGYLASQNATINPSFHNWSMVYVRYWCVQLQNMFGTRCEFELSSMAFLVRSDGSSFSGLRIEPIRVAGRNIYHRGNYILRAVIAELKSSIMASATHVVISGDSAGGLATYLHAHQWRRALPPTVAMVALPDSGTAVNVY